MAHAGQGDAQKAQPAQGGPAAAVAGATTSGAAGAARFGHLHVVRSNEAWCAHPCDQPSWELAAPKPSPSSSYVLVEAAIWTQNREVVLYRFDDEWFKNASDVYHSVCHGKWSCPAYREFREARALFRAGPWPAEADRDEAVLSAFLRDSFEKVFDKLAEEAGAGADLGLTFSGHGGQADGSLFEGQLIAEDAHKLLQQHLDRNGKFSLLNFGTNCQEGRWKMLAAFQPFADWILASDLNVGGLADTEHLDIDVDAQERLSDVSVLKKAMESSMTVRAAAEEIVAARRRLWAEVWREGVVQQRLRQSISLFNPTQLPDFEAALHSAFQALPASQHGTFKEDAETANCDVLAVVQLLDRAQQAPPSSFLAGGRQAKDRGRNGRRLLHNNGGSSLEAQFEALRPLYASTRALFTWSPNETTHGLAFNFAYKRSQRYCDLSPLGAA